MAEKTSKRLQIVLQLAKLKERQAAEKLASSIREVEAQQQQLEQLEQYKIEYGEQFQRRIDQSVSASQLSNFQNFYNNLEQVGDTQQERQVLVSQQRDQARRQWQQQYSRQKNMETLIERKYQEEQLELDNQVQREQDDRPPKGREF